MVNPILEFFHYSQYIDDMISLYSDSDWSHSRPGRMIRSGTPIHDTDTCPNHFDFRIEYKTVGQNMSSKI